MKTRTNKVKIDVPDGATVYVWYEKETWAETTWTVQVDVVFGDADLKAHARYETNREPDSMMLGKIAANTYLAWKDAR